MPVGDVVGETLGLGVGEEDPEGLGTGEGLAEGDEPRERMAVDGLTLRHGL